MNRFSARSRAPLSGLVAAASLLALSGATQAQSVPSPHVLLLSIDGMHAFDLALYAQQNPASALAGLLQHGVNYTSAASARPADSFPGILAITTGGTPASTGVYFDLSYDRSLYPPGVTSGPTGTIVDYSENVDLNPVAPDGGGGLDETKLPLDPNRNNAPVYPHNYVRVNTIFEVIRAAGLRTAWSDKHLTDEIVNGPSGHGVDDLYIPEIAAVNGSGVSITKSLAMTETYDDGKVQALLNEIDGYDHARSVKTGVPAIFGMNFQAISVAQRLNKNKTPSNKNVTGALAGPGGYTDALGTPSALLADALSHTDTMLGRIVQELKTQGLYDSTYIVLTAKHGQAPIDITTLKYIDPSTLPNLIEPSTGPILGTSGDNAELIWLQDQTKSATAAAIIYGNQATVPIQDVLFDTTLKLLFPDPKLDPRTPDLVVIGKPGSIFSTSTGKIAEHGGFLEADTHVPIVISNPRLAPQTVRIPVQTTQIAPTILRLLGLNPFDLQAVVLERTALLPGFEANPLPLENPARVDFAQSPNAITHLADGLTEVNVSGVRTQWVTLQASADLSSWTSISTNPVVVRGSATLTDTNAAPRKFYRLLESN